MSQANLDEIGIENSIENQVLKLAQLTQLAGLHGVVCSALEAPSLRQQVEPDFLLVTPGIRPATANKDDQTRILTPIQALATGASYLVVGRPITQASNPIDALIAINQEIQSIN